MSKNEEGRQEAEANPYNRNKAWHTEDVMPQKLDNADEGLFVPNPDSKQSKSTATAEGNPEDSTEFIRIIHVKSSLIVYNNVPDFDIVSQPIFLVIC